MIRAPIQFELPRSLEEALTILAEAREDARVLGGGSILVTALSAGLDAPKIVIDPARLGLDRITEVEGGVEIGARATYAALLKSKIVRERLPLLHAMVGDVTGGPGLWNLATLGGSSCYANPASDGPACLTALRAEFHLQSIDGKRLVSAGDFFRGAFTTDRAPHEILTHIRVPFDAVRPRVAYFKLKHAASSWPMVTGACMGVTAGEQLRVRLGMGGLAERPVFAEWTLDSTIDGYVVERLAMEALGTVTVGWSDDLADGDYRLKAARAVAVRVLRSLVEEK